MVISFIVCFLVLIDNHTHWNPRSYARRPAASAMKITAIRIKIIKI